MCCMIIRDFRVHKSQFHWFFRFLEFSMYFFFFHFQAVLAMLLFKYWRCDLCCRFCRSRPDWHFKARISLHAWSKIIFFFLFLFRILTRLRTNFRSMTARHFNGKLHSYIASENLLIRFGKGNLPCLPFEQKSLQMPVILAQRHCQCLLFHLKW